MQAKRLHKNKVNTPRTQNKVESGSKARQHSSLTSTYTCILIYLYTNEHTHMCNTHTHKYKLQIYTEFVIPKILLQHHLCLGIIYTFPQTKLRQSSLGPQYSAMAPGKPHRQQLSETRSPILHTSKLRLREKHHLKCSVSGD